MLNYNKLKYFTVAARHLNFSAAAQELYIGQPTLSTHIKDLERELGVALFDRSHRGLTLTPAGQVLYQEVRDFFDREDELVRKVRATVPQDHVTLNVGTLGCDIIYALPNIIRLFQAAYPAIGVSLRRMNITPLSQALADGSVDLAFQFMSDYRDESVLKSYCTYTVQRSRLLIAMAANHPLADRGVIRAVDLKGCKIAIQSRKETPAPYLFLQDVCRKAGFAPNIAAEFQFIEPMLTAISMSDMVTVTSTLAPLRGLENIRLVEFEDSISMQLDLIWKKDAANPAVPLFVSHVRQLVEQGAALA